MNSSSRRDFETAWLAYRYVSRDLSAADQAAFEEQLAADQSARETVAEIVELCAALETVPAQAFAPPGQLARVWRPLGWMSVGAAACLALVLGLPTARRAMSPQSAQRDETAAANDQRLALTWTQQSQPADVDEGPLTDEAVTDSNTEASEADESEAGLEPPSWVTAAVDGTESKAPAQLHSEESN